MRKLSILVLSLFVLGLFGGCGTEPADTEDEITSEVAVIPDEPFTMDYEMADSTSYFAENDNMEVYRAASPYYLGDHSLNIPAFNLYEPLRKRKVEEAIKLTQELYDLTLELNEKSMPFKGAMMEFIGVASPNEKGLDKFVAEFSDFFVGALVEENALIAYYDALNEGEADDAFVQAHIEYIKTIVSTKLAAVILNENANTVLNAAYLSVIFEESDNQSIKNALKVMDAQMEKVSDLNGLVEQINEKGIELNTAVRQLETGEYYMAMASLEYVQSEMPALKTAIESIKPRDDLTAEDIETVKEIAKFYEELAPELLASMKELDTTDLFDEKMLAYAVGDSGVDFGPVPVAKAGFLDKMKAGYNAVKSTTSSLASTAYNKTANGISYTYNKAKDIGRETQKRIGYGLDVTGSLIKAPMDLGWGLYEGNSMEDIYKRQMNNYEEVEMNWINNQSGVKTLDLAVATLDEVENMAKNAAEKTTEFAFDKSEQFADYMSEKITGEKLDEDGFLKNSLAWSKDWTTWGMGHAGKLTAGLFTGLGKGVYRLSNQDSTAAELAEGTIDVAFSFLGGSKLVGKASQFLTAGKNVTKMYLQKGVNFVAKWGLDKGVNKLKPLVTYLSEKGGGKVMNFLTESLESNANKLVSLSSKLGEKGKLMREGIEEYWKKAPGKALNTLWENLKGGKDAYKEFVKQEFENTWKGYLKALHSGAGTTLVDYIDNIAGNKADDYIKQFTKYLLEEENAFEGAVVEGETGLNESGVVENDSESDVEEDVMEEETGMLEEGYDVSGDEGTGVANSDNSQDDVSMTDSSTVPTLVSGSVGDYDGVYSGVWLATGQQFNVTANIEGGVISSTINYNDTIYGSAVSSVTYLNGTVDESGYLSGSLSGTGSAMTQGISTSSLSSGSFDGQIVGDTATVNATVNSSSTTMGQTVGNSFSGSFDLYKQ